MLFSPGYFSIFLRHVHLTLGLTFCTIFLPHFPVPILLPHLIFPASLTSLCTHLVSIQFSHGHFVPFFPTSTAHLLCVGFRACFRPHFCFTFFLRTFISVCLFAFCSHYSRSPHRACLSITTVCLLV